MRILISIMMMAASAWGANYNCTSSGTGNFNAAGTWASCNSTFPNNSTDTFTFSVGAGHTVTLPTGVEVTVGQSLAANTAQGTVGTTGQLVLAADLTGTDPTILTMKGDLAITTVNSTCTVCDGVVMNPGTVVKVDSDGSGTAYAIGQTANGSARWFRAQCADSSVMPAYNSGTTYSIGQRVAYQNVNYISIQDSHSNQTPNMFDSAYWKRGNCAVLSVGATNAVFNRRGFGFGGGNVYFRNVAINNFGTSSVDSVEVMPNASNNPNGGADIADTSFSNSGSVDLDGGDRTATSIHRLNGSILTGCLSTTACVLFNSASSAAITTGVREIIGNVSFGVIGTAGTSYCYDCTVEGNYTYTTGTGMPYPWIGGVNGSDLLSFKGNLILNYGSGNALSMNVPTSEWNYVVNGPGRSNVRCIDMERNKTANQNGTIQYNVCANLGGDDTGDAFLVTQSSQGLTFNFLNNVNELNRDGESCCNVVTSFGTSSPGGTDNHVVKNNSHLSTTWGLLNIETNYHWAGSITFQNNSITRFGASATKVIDTASCTLNPNDMCSAAGCNYNLGVDLSYTAPGGCTNAHNGYIMDLSAASGWGANDKNIATVAEAHFTDLTRTFATAANDWLGNTTATAWSSASVSYTTGQIVSDVQSGVWQGKTVLYRALANHTSAATNRPANGATWQTDCGGGPCWEYATAYYLREMIGKGQRVTDAAIGANNDYPAQAMAKWVMYGRLTAARLDLACMGSDGESPWPIPYCAKAKARLGASAF